MKAFVCLVMFLIGSVVTDLAGECNLAGFYLELGCTALPKADNSTICPDAFKCPDLHPDPTKCYYRGVPYGDKSTVPQALIGSPCSQSCMCQMYDGVPQFACAVVDCVESFDSDRKQQCIDTYDLESCCSTGNVCGKDAIASLKTCEVDGETYREGQLFEPKNTAKTCICTGDWNGSTENSYCRNLNCGIELHAQEKILENCAPMFIDNMRGCPIGFQCPSTTTKVITGLNRRSVASQCLFGNLTLNVGDEVTVEENCTRCSCDVPPFVACIKKIVCDDN